MPATEAAATVRALVAAIPQDCLRDLVVQLVLNGLAAPDQKRVEGEHVPLQRNPTAPDPAQRRRERARKWAAEKRAAARKEAAAAKPLPQAKPAAKRGRKPRGTGNGQEAGAMWKKAQELEPTRPWLAVARELGVKEAVAQAAHRTQTMPPSINRTALARFVAQPPA
jgi:hypothetical protein